MLSRILDSKISVGLICCILLFDLVGSGLQMMGLPIIVGLVIRTAFVVFTTTFLRQIETKKAVFVAFLGWASLELVCWSLMAYLSDMSLAALILSSR